MHNFYVDMAIFWSISALMYMCVHVHNNNTTYGVCMCTCKYVCMVLQLYLYTHISTKIYCVLCIIVISDVRMYFIWVTEYYVKLLYVHLQICSRLILIHLNLTYHLIPGVSKLLPCEFMSEWVWVNEFVHEYVCMSFWLSVCICVHVLCLCISYLCVSLYVLCKCTYVTCMWCMSYICNVLCRQMAYGSHMMTSHAHMMAQTSPPHMTTVQMMNDSDHLPSSVSDCVYVCVYAHVCTCTYMCTCVWTCVCMCICEGVYLCLFVRVCMCVCIYMCVHLYVYACVYACVRIHVYVHVCIEGCYMLWHCCCIFSC